MSTVLTPAPDSIGDSRVILQHITWDAYVAIDDAIAQSPDLRLTFIDGRLTFLTASRSHEWYAERMAQLVVAVANACGILWEDAGSATFRQRKKEIGVEGDKTFYFGPNADLMRGSRNIDLSTQPPPDLAIEVEVTHPADDSLLVYGRLGVPEVWRFDVDRWALSVCLLQDDGTYSQVSQAKSLPVLGSAEILDQLQLADAIGAARWFMQLDGWVRTTLLPRIGE